MITKDQINYLHESAAKKRLEWKLAQYLRRYWSFDERQQPTNSWHTREDFIEKVLPKLLDDA